MFKKIARFLIENSHKPTTTVPVYKVPSLSTHSKKHTNLQFIDSFINNTFVDQVKPKVGSVVHCGLLGNQVEHSGIYVGYGKIVHLDGSGLIEKVTPEQFLNRLGGLDMAISIYVSCKNGEPVAMREAALMAKDMIGVRLEYNVFKNNCHMFVANCLKNHPYAHRVSIEPVWLFESRDWTFAKLEKVCSESLGSNEWRVWDLAI